MSFTKGHVPSLPSSWAGHALQPADSFETAACGAVGEVGRNTYLPSEPIISLSEPEQRIWDGTTLRYHTGLACS